MTKAVAFFSRPLGSPACRAEQLNSWFAEVVGL